MSNKFPEKVPFLWDVFCNICYRSRYGYVDADGMADIRPLWRHIFQEHTKEQVIESFRGSLSDEEYEVTKVKYT